MVTRLALKYFTPKNEYLTITIKYGIRFSLYALGFLSNNSAICFLAMTWSIFISTAYENVVSAPYINRVPNKFQLVYTNYRYIVGLLGTSIGLYFAGIVYPYGIPSLLGVSAVFLMFQLVASYRLIYLRTRKTKITPQWKIQEGEDTNLEEAVQTIKQ